MALHLKVSNSLSELAKALCIDLKLQEQGVFQPHIIVTQTDGMNNWLKLQFAEYMGIAANYQFYKPNDIINQIYYLLGGQGNGDIVNAENTSWLIYTLLADPVFISRFRSVSDYYSDEVPDKDVKRMGLADKIADLFDQYQIYRPEMIMDWNAGDQQEQNIADWQQYLWVKARRMSSLQLPDKTLVGQYIMNALSEGSSIEYLKANIPAIHVFGLSITTGYHLSLFYEIAKHINFSFHILNPSPEVYWFEDKSDKQLAWMKERGFIEPDEKTTGNPLLTSWGKVIQNTFHLFFQNDEMLNVYKDIPSAEPVPDSLLHKIQHDVFFNSVEEYRNKLSVSDLRDGSITINSCFTPIREVEVLYNYLVHLVDKKGEFLSPRDIVVMVSDIDAYAPFIKAVFTNAPYYFPYTIADENYTSTDTISNALTALLSIDEESFRAEDVLQLLDSSYIRRRFGITDLALIRSAVNQANIRFGKEGSETDDTVYVSWKYGIKRLMYGICMLGQDEYGSGQSSFYPVDKMEGAASYEIISFCHFVEVLMDSVRQRSTKRGIGAWVQYVQHVLDNLVWDIEDGTEEDLEILLSHLNSYNLLTPLLTDEVSFDVFRHKFLQNIAGSKRAASFVQGGITFCSLIPMRSIPFKVVALMGLDFDKFPRKETPVSFNLLERNKKRGDRNVKENDKHLFLETILSAQEYFYISYIGQSTKDNTVIPPSALVDELIDYIGSGTTEKTDLKNNLVTRHPLHNFSQKYWLDSERFYNYTLQTSSSEKSPLLSGKQKEVTVLNEVTVEALIGFFKNPFKGYYNKVLNIHYNTERVLLDDTELFDLDNLQRWNLKQVLLSATPADVSALRKKLVKTGGLPLKSMADIALSQAEQDVSAIRDLFTACTVNTIRRTIYVDMELDHVRLTGSFDQVYGDKLIFVSWSKNETKYLMEAYIRYLLVRASGEQLKLCFISSNKKEIFEAAEVETEEAIQKLEELLLLYKSGHSRILGFYPDLNIAPDEFLNLQYEKFQSKIKKKFDDSQFPCSDKYAVKEYRKGYFKSEDVYEDFMRNGEILLMPLVSLFPRYYK